MIKIKICGIGNQEDAELACMLGAWALGFIFVENSPRYIKPDLAGEIIKSLPLTIEKIGVFADYSPEEIKDIAQKTGITQIQLHGDESQEFCANLSKIINLPIIRAIRVKSSKDLLKIPVYKNIVSSILLDTYSESQLGGTGTCFDWSIAVEAKSYGIPIILAGGISSENISEAYLKVQPYAVDISSGVEKEKGIKDHNKLNNLFMAANGIIPG